ncbi:D-alanyl-D-alanine carboxypeptidase/D-alanyl-D-alanine endopeptidase [Limnobacter parvus]|uniref:D-alanyl-D-alanine carboxypeptidase/D-alanyl-D-alanine-endopeptidase n=1 Tax=Limnobacter parvus TaxID=2939690 RepID=A0ABT1XJL2_9BURK|nr:D-alanyl-D-alanine carboxypeptidase/D-alanyl-D-alanine-endopeptidase [Limnobacter parvus]MCR2746284.1 D-alanyl-D-alanine carboxypeptidase/D-alanyl-D-alanine-endopeptidase [Limnobacter parvus]
MTFVLLIGLTLAQFSWANTPDPTTRAFPSAVTQSFVKKGIANNEFTAYALPIAPFVKRNPQAYSHGSTQLVNPASVAKVFTTGLALQALESTYRFKTGFHVGAEPVDGVLNGALYIKGSGDPAFLTGDLWSSLRQLRTKGVDVINGPVVLDDSAFSEQMPSLGLAEDDAFDDAPHRAYHAQPDALLMNFGAMSIDLKLNENTLVVVPEEAPRGWAFVSEVNLTNGGCGAWKNGMSIDFAKSGQNVVVTVKGNYPRKCGQSRLPIRVPVQDWLWESWVKEIWVQLGGKFSGPQGGQVIKGITPVNTIALYTHYGKPISDLVKQINKWSSNVMARHLELAVAGTPELFNQQMKEWLRTQGIASQDWFFENGSGLSRNTRIDAKGLTEFLRYMATRSDFPDFLASFPRAGADGTLNRRVNNVAGFAYLKTGSLNGVRSLGGYLRDREGQMWAVGILVKSPKAWDSWVPMESLLEFLYRAESQ